MLDWSKEFEVGQFVRDLKTGKVGEIYAIRYSIFTGDKIHSVKFEAPRKNRGHNFYTIHEIEAVDDEDS